MNKIFTISYLLLFLLFQNGVSQETNPLYLDNHTSGDGQSIYIKSIRSAGNSPQMLFHLPYVGGQDETNSLFEFSGDDSGERHTIFRFETSGDNVFEMRGWSDGKKSDLWFGDENDNKFTIQDNGRVGIGVLNPSHQLHVDGSVRLNYPGRFYIKRSNVTSEQFLSTNGQGGGLMFNATYDGSGNPQSNSTFTVEAGQHNTSAGYLDFDGNSKNWSFNLSNSSPGIGSAVSWQRVAFFDNSQIILSPTGNSSDFHLDSNGKLGLGTTNPSHKLTVAGTINSKEIIVEETAGADFVFADDYDLPTLEEIEAFISENNHLPGIAPATEMIEEGVKVGELQIQLLQKIEELTLHVIELNKANQQLLSRNNELHVKVQKLEENYEKVNNK